MKHFSKIIAFAVLGLSACSGPAPKPETPIKPIAATAATHWPSLAKQFSCLPDSAAFLAAHRGNSRGTGLAENAGGSLEALIKAGVLIAEVDVAGLKDGTHVLFHDGVWDEKSTGKGAVAASNWAQVKTYLLQDDKGALTADRPIKFVDALALAKGRLYLEIDFKSSASETEIVDLIRAADMTDDVILIAYSRDQAARLTALAPDMLISASVREIGDVKAYRAQGISTDKLTAWLGKGAANKTALTKALRAQGVPVLAMTSGPNEGELAPVASLVVTDYALKHIGENESEYSGIVGMNDSQYADYKSCLKQ